MKIGLITSEPAKLAYYFPTLAEPLLVSTEPPFTPDDQLAVNALRAIGHQVHPVIWGEPAVNLTSFDLIIVRSPWDYMDTADHTQRFLEWIKTLEQTGKTVANPLAVMKWLLDKHYLGDLQQQGIDVIPTEYLPKKGALNLVDTFHNKGEFILKPCISAAGIGLFHIRNQEEAAALQAEVQARLTESSYMLQPLIPEIMTHGEWSLTFIGGQYSHAIHKRPAPNNIMVHAERGGSIALNVSPPMNLIDFANTAYSKIAAAFHQATGQVIAMEKILYLRLDVIETKTGPVIIECEGVEPELFFRAAPSSAQKFAQAITKLYT